MISFKTVQGSDLRRFRINPELEALRAHIAEIYGRESDSFNLTYADDEGDEITIVNQADLDEAVAILPPGGTLRVHVKDLAHQQQAQTQAPPQSQSQSQPQQQQQPQGDDPFTLLASIVQQQLPALYPFWEQVLPQLTEAVKRTVLQLKGACAISDHTPQFDCLGGLSDGKIEGFLRSLPLSPVLPLIGMYLPMARAMVPPDVVGLLNPAVAELNAVVLSLVESVKGQTPPAQQSASPEDQQFGVTCPKCNGSGNKGWKGRPWKACKKCRGSGRIDPSNCRRGYKHRGGCGKGGSSRPNGEQPAVHHGIVCDGCNTSPIVGKRFKCQSCPDFDLCEQCHSQGNKVHDPSHTFMTFSKSARGPWGVFVETQDPSDDGFRPFGRCGWGRRGGRGGFFRSGGPPHRPFWAMGGGPPAAHWHGQQQQQQQYQQQQQQQYQQQQQQQYQQQQQQQQPMETTAPDAPAPARLAARFVKDVTIFDGTEIEPNKAFTKMWKVRNELDQWPEDTVLQYVGGDLLGAEVNRVDKLKENTEGNIAIDLTSPSAPGRYIGYYRLSAGGRKFGQRMWVDIQVIPEGSANDDVTMAVEETQAKGEASNDAAMEEEQPDQAVDSVVEELTTAVADELAAEEQQTEAPSAPPAYPVLDPVQPTASAPAPTTAPAEPEKPTLAASTINVDTDIESATNQLAEMGFDNREVTAHLLKKHEGKMRSAIFDLVQAAEYTAQLDKLSSMGFGDQALNTELLLKHNGNVEAVLDELTTMGAWEVVN